MASKQPNQMLIADRRCYTRPAVRIPADRAAARPAGLRTPRGWPPAIPDGRVDGGGIVRAAGFHETARAEADGAAPTFPAVLTSTCAERAMTFQSARLGRIGNGRELRVCVGQIKLHERVCFFAGQDNRRGFAAFRGRAHLRNADRRSRRGSGGAPTFPERAFQPTR